MTRHLPDYPDKEIVRMAREYPVLIDETRGVEPNYQSLHHHNVLEINLIKSGTGFYIINGERYDFESGDIFLINNYDLHCAYETRDLVIFIFEFDIEWLSGIYRMDPGLASPFTRMGIEFVSRLDRDNPRMPALRELLLRVQRTHAEAEPLFHTLVFADLLQFLVLVNRHFRVSRVDMPLRSVGADALEKVKYVLEKLEEAPERPWNVSEMADLVFFSASHFSELFRKTIGISPMRYLINIRLEKACRLIDQGDQKILDIALCCGFNSLTNFNRLFKRYMHTEPREYKANRRIVSQ